MTCAIYCRLSKEDADKIEESESIQNQKNMLISYAVSQEWNVYNIYCDEDYSGADRDRPGFGAMLRDAQEGKFQIVLCKTQSRFTRDMEMVEKYIHGLFPLWGIRFVALVDNIDTDVKGNKKARQISGLINEWYLEDLSENVRAVFAQKRKAGLYIASFAAYGYCKDPADKNHLLIDEEAAGVVREIFKLYLEGRGTHAIAACLNSQGIPNPTRYKQQKGLLFRGRQNSISTGFLWSSSTVSGILRHEIYLGTTVQGTRRKASYKNKKLLQVPKEQWIKVENTHEPIIDRETFDAVQRRLALHTRSDGTGTVHLLAGKVVCADCGSTMHRLSHTYKGVQKSYLQCKLYAADRGHPKCTGHTIRLDRLTELVEEKIRTYVDQYYTLGDVNRFQPARKNTGREKELRKELAALKSQEIRLKGALKALYLDKVDGIVGGEDFAEMNQSLRDDKQALVGRIQRMEAQLEELRKSAEDDSVLRERLEQLLRLETVNRDLIDLLVERVEVGEKNPELGEQPVQIHWKF